MNGELPRRLVAVDVGLDNRDCAADCAIYNWRSAGTHRLRVSRAGFRNADQEVTVRAGEEALVAVRLEEVAVELDGMVVSASRRAERRSEAPATVTRIGPEVLENVAGNSFAGALKQANGLDFVQVGMTSVGFPGS